MLSDKWKKGRKGYSRFKGIKKNKIKNHGVVDAAENDLSQGFPPP